MKIVSLLRRFFRGWFPAEPKTPNYWSKYKVRITLLLSFTIIVVSIITVGVWNLGATTQMIPPPPLPEIPTLESDYHPGISVGDYVIYGNFVCKFEHQEEDAVCHINDLAFRRVEVIAVSGSEVTFLYTEQYKNGIETPKAGCTETLDVEAAWWSDDTEYCMDYSLIIAANLTEGSCIHLGECDFPGHTVVGIEERTYLGLSRDVIPLRYPNTIEHGLNVTHNFVYDQESGIKLEQKVITTDGDVVWAMSIIETNIFSVKGGENDNE
jgi:hypothetical protein